MSKKTLALILTLFVVTLLLIFVAIRNSNQPSTPQPDTSDPSAISPTESYAGKVLLSVSPAVITTRSGSGSASTADILIDSQGDSVTAVQLEIAYNPAVLTNMQITAGDFFETPIVLPVGGVNKNTGRITFQVTPGQLGSAKNGKGTVATLRFNVNTASGATSTPITLLEKSLVSGRVGTRTINTSLLKSVSGAVVQIQNTSPVVTQPVVVQQ